LSKNGEGNTDDVVKFTALPDEEGQNEPDKLSKLVAYLQDSMEPDEYTKVLSILGAEKDISNAQLLAEIQKLAKKKKDDDEEEEEDDYPEPKNAASYKDFMEECMKDGTSMSKCAAEYKKKYPEAGEAKKSEIAEVEELAKQLAKKKKDDDEEEEEEEDKEMSQVVKDLQARVKQLEERNKELEVQQEVEDLIGAKHLSPKQREDAKEVIKLADSLGPELKQPLLNVFKKQKFNVSDDVGMLDGDTPPGKTDSLSPEEVDRIVKNHGLDSLILDKANKRSLPETLRRDN